MRRSSSASRAGSPKPPSRRVQARAARLAAAERREEEARARGMGGDTKLAKELSDAQVRRRGAGRAVLAVRVQNQSSYVA